MAVSILDMAYGTTPLGPRYKRQRAEMLRGQLELERASFIPVWQDCNNFILPQRGRFQVTDVNKGNRRNLAIIDSTGTLAARVCSAGMVAGITSPARPWFELTTPSPELAEQADVKAWLHEVAEILRGIFLRSNFYNEIPTLYGDIATFGTGAMLVMEDEEDVIRCYDFPVGSYAVGNDYRRQIRLFSRVFRLSVQQVVERWGQIDQTTGKPNFMDGRASTISLSVQNLWHNGSRQAWIDLAHIIQPNLSYDGQKIDATFKRFEELYYEIGTPSNVFSDKDGIGLLAHSGYDEFPVLVARWETSGEDVYGTNWPGLTALGDIKQLQTGAKRIAQAVEKMINPPMTGPAALRSAAASILPGNITYSDVSQGQLGFRPVHEVNFGTAIGPMNENLQETRNRIKEAYFVNLFLMLEQSDRREFTATEIMERKEEKLLVVGPVLEQVSQDVLNPIIARTYSAAYRRGMIPQPPEALHNQQLVPIYVSVMAQAQKQSGLSGLERFAGMLGQLVQISPDAIDNFDSDEFVGEYSEGAGIPPKIIRPEDAVAAIRDQRQKAQQAAQAAENAPKVAGAVKDLASSPTDGNTALAALVGSAHARQTVNATANPPESAL